MSIECMYETESYCDLTDRATDCYGDLALCRTPEDIMCKSYAAELFVDAVESRIVRYISSGKDRESCSKALEPVFQECLDNGKGIFQFQEKIERGLREAVPGNPMVEGLSEELGYTVSNFLDIFNRFEPNMRIRRGYGVFPSYDKLRRIIFRIAPVNKWQYVLEEIVDVVRENGLPDDTRTLSPGGTYAWEIERILRDAISSPQRRAVASERISSVFSEFIDLSEQFEERKRKWKRSVPESG